MFISALQLFAVGWAPNKTLLCSAAPGEFQPEENDKLLDKIQDKSFDV